MAITKREQDALRFIEAYVEANDLAPTTREIADGIGIKSRGVVHRYLQSLQDEGYIRLDSGRRRNIELVSRHDATQIDAPANDTESSLPLLGKIAAGSPIEAISQAESLDVADMFVGAGRYALRVSGDSMIDEGILDGDLVVIQQADVARSGQIVVALVDGDFATLKRITYEDNGMVVLHPANAMHKPLVYAADRVAVQGIFVGLLRLSTHRSKH